MQCLVSLGIGISVITKSIVFPLRHHRLHWTIKYCGMWLSSSDVQLCAKFVFDMEYIGNIEDGLDSCHPWEIAVQCVDTNAKFY